jgi:hypothetical protein
LKTVKAKDLWTRCRRGNVERLQEADEEERMFQREREGAAENTPLREREGATEDTPLISPIDTSDVYLSGQYSV